MAKKTVTPGERLRRMREALDLGPRAFARQARLPEPTVVGLESGTIATSTEAFGHYLCALTEIGLRRNAERATKLERMLAEIKAKTRVAKAKAKRRARR